MNQMRRAKQAGLGGFVAMMDRKSAEQAVKELDGFEWNGSVLRTGWGKSMPLPPRPAYGLCPVTLVHIPLAHPQLGVEQSPARHRQLHPVEVVPGRLPDTLRHRERKQGQGLDHLVVDARPTNANVALALIRAHAHGPERPRSELGLNCLGEPSRSYSKTSLTKCTTMGPSLRTCCGSEKRIIPNSLSCVIAKWVVV